MDSNKKIDLVVVYLTTARQKVIVPETYINGYSHSFLKHLKNKGNNASRDHLIFWSNEIVEGEFYPEPDQNAKELQSFPPEKNGWYRGRTLWFTDDLQEAKMVRNRKRNVTPPVYNEARLSEKPLPVLVLVPDKPNSEANDDSEENEAVDPLDASSISNAIDDDATDLWTTMTEANSSNLSAATDSNALDLIQFSPNSDNAPANGSNESQLDESNVSVESNFDALDDLPNNVDETANSNNNNVSFNFDDTIGSTLSVLDELDVSDPTLDNKGNDLMASASDAGGFSSSAYSNEPVASNSSFAMNQNDSAILSVALDSALNIQVKKEPEFSSMNDEDCDAVTSIFDGSYENVNDSDDDVLIHRNDVIPPPKKTDAVHYTVKKNDIISGSIPFAVNKSDDRAYLISKGQSCKQVTLMKRVIDGLMQFNSSGFRESLTYDMRFIKALLISLIGRQKLAANDSDELTMDFIHDLYEIRKGEKVDISEFEQIVADATEQIKNNKYN